MRSDAAPYPLASRIKGPKTQAAIVFFAPNVTTDFAAFILIHELAHFTSRRDGQIIDDNGRGWFDDTFIKPLSAAQRLLNVDSYASFAHGCRTGSAAKPRFVKTAPGGLGRAVTFVLPQRLRAVTRIPGWEECVRRKFPVR